MTAHAPMARVPFAPLDNPRLQHLASAKNRQNGLTSKGTIPSGKTAISSITSPTKRPFEPAIFDDFDNENVDPASLSSPSKKSKSDVSEKPFKPFTFTMSPSKSMLPPPPSARLSTPARANMSSPRAPLTAPAGRSPTKRKGSALLNNKARRTSAPFSRIDPPSFNASRSSSTLPFSLDAALSGTFSTPVSTSSSNNKMSAGSTIAESMPKNWFFDIHEDTPEEEASNLMEHSTLTLDLSSDDESEKRLNDERGKENMPPEGYDAVTASRTVGEPVAAPTRVKKVDIVRKKVAAEEMDDGERSPLASLETEPFIPEGLTETHILVETIPEKPKDEAKSLFAVPVPFTNGGLKQHSKKSSLSNVVDVPVVSSAGDVRGDIVIWQDSPSPGRTPLIEPTPTVSAGADEHSKALADENTPPSAKDVVL